MIIWVPGAMRTASEMRTRIGGIGDSEDNLFWGLPGHGGEPITNEVSISSWANALASFIVRHRERSREFHVIGESLGGTVALAMVGLALPQVKTVVTVDAPLTMSKQWALQKYLRAIGRSVPEHDFLHAMIERIFGIMPDGTQSERNYYPLLDQCVLASGPRVYAICSDLPLWPSENRSIDPMPSTNDEVDRYMLGRAGVEAHMIAGPHNLLDVSTQACKAMIGRCLAGR